MSRRIRNEKVSLAFERKPCCNLGTETGDRPGLKWSVFASWGGEGQHPRLRWCLFKYSIRLYVCNLVSVALADGVSRRKRTCRILENRSRKILSRDRPLPRGRGGSGAPCSSYVVANCLRAGILAQSAMDG